MAALGFSHHPRGLATLFLVEMWERFSYYGMRALLTLYLTKQLLFTDDMAYGIYGAYTSMVYLTPIFGGMLADRLIGFRKAVTWGALLMAAGHFAMAFESTLHLALGLLIVGNGFFKPNMSTIVGRLYEEGDPRRDGGYTIFYMGVNVGAFLAPLLCGYVGETYGWHYGFGIAGVGMLVGLLNFTIRQRVLEGRAEPPDPERLARPLVAGLNREWAVYIGSIVPIAFATWLVSRFNVVQSLLTTVSIAVIVGLVLFMVARLDSVARSRLAVAMLLCLFGVSFWSLFEQAGSSINLFTDRNVDRDLFGWTIPTTWFQSVNPLFIIVFAPVFSWLWTWLAARKLEPSTPLKFSLGIFQLGLGFLALFLATRLAADGSVHFAWLLLGYLLHTTGELCVSPVGLSSISKLSPAKILGLMMGVWYLAFAYAQILATVIARMTSISTGEVGEAVSKAESVGVYGSVFGQVGLLICGVSLFMFLLVPFLKRGMKGIH
ncbi:MAG: MFS transporter [Acidobacteria bacterium]|nr:MFS transporter [Acidobacteriota bacterium]NIM63466.1 MFS transporter [Acidobacteriota bacterium]NIO60894.1 MFS transporter [Acidobacteriota bacterium]NIQ31086.1 MFS transporter [Acidobacteriota bacterium]NIQ87355.1 MFS transporter [Acidobacteriota bacterium]